METAHQDHPFWEDSSSETRHQLIEEDRVAWRHVCSLLLAIISFGLLLGITAVTICVKLSAGGAP